MTGFTAWISRSTGRPLRSLLGESGAILLGAGLLLVFAVLAVFADALAPNDPTRIDLLHRLTGPSGRYPLGTDHLGRCVLSRIMSGTGTSFGAALSATGMILALALPVGVTAAMRGGWVDAVCMRIADIFLAFPMLVLALAVIGFMGASLSAAVLGVALAWWPALARLVRTLTLAAKDMPFVAASRRLGIGEVTLFRRHILPQIVPPLLVVVSLELAGLLLVLSSLSFLGVGAQPPVAEWGAMLNEARPFFAERPGLLLAPGAIIIAAVTAFNLVGEGMRHWLEQRSPYRW